MKWAGNRAVWVPVFWYLAETLGAPAANGAAARAEFWRHAASVAVVVAGLVAARLLVCVVLEKSEHPRQRGCSAGVP